MTKYYFCFCFQPFKDIKMFLAHRCYKNGQQTGHSPYTSLSTPNLKHEQMTFLVAQWIRMHPALQGTWVPSLVSEIPHAMGQTRPRATTTAPAFYRARAAATEAHELWSLCSRETTATRRLLTAVKSSLPLAPTRERPVCIATKSQCTQKLKKKKKFRVKNKCIGRNLLEKVSTSGPRE